MKKNKHSLLSMNFDLVRELNESSNKIFGGPLVIHVHVVATMQIMVVQAHVIIVQLIVYLERLQSVADRVVVLQTMRNISSLWAVIRVIGY